MVQETVRAVGSRVMKIKSGLGQLIARWRNRLYQTLLRMKAILSQESDDTREMLDIYYRHTLGRASPEDLQIAHKQFGDLLRAVGLGFLAILPAAPVTIPFFVSLGRRFGVEILPRAFRGNSHGKDEGDSVAPSEDKS